MRGCSREIGACLTEARRLHAAGELQAASAAYTAILAAAPDEPAVQGLLGALEAQLGHHAEAAALIRDALRLAPEMASGWQNLVVPLLALGRIEDAIAAASEAVRLAPDVAGCHHNLSLALARAGRFEEAAAAATRTLAIDPQHAGGWLALGHTRAAVGEHAEAIRHFRRALTIEPGHAEGHYNLAVSLEACGNTPEAEAEYRRALAGDPPHHGAFVNLGALLRNQRRGAEAIAVWEAGLARIPDSSELRFNIACARLQAGAWPGGWNGYEERWAVRGLALPVGADVAPRWDGRPLPHGTLLVHHEQGLGDTIQFIRCLAPVLERVRDLVLVCQPTLMRLLTSLPAFHPGPDGTRPRARLIGDGTPLPPVDAWVPLLSLPGLLGLTVATAPSPQPCLFAEADRLRQWRQRITAEVPANSPKAAIAAGTAFRVGLHWQGNPHAPAEKGRSIPLAAFAPLADVEGVALFSLQKNAGREQLIDPPAGMVITDLGTELDIAGDAFVDTAAALHALDLLITSDTAIAHLAGALGRPVWVLLKAVPDWRWGLTAGLSPWYGSLRLFRQPSPGDWGGLMRAVASELAALVALRRDLAEAPAFATTAEAAIALHQAGRSDEAASHYRALLKADCDQPALLNLLAMARAQQENWSRTALDSALVLGYRAACLAPADPDIHANLGLLLKRAGRLEDAEISLRRALALAPGHAGAVQNLVNLLMQAARHEEAVSVAEQACGARANDPPLLAALALALRTAGRIGEAERACQRLVTIEPGESRHWVALGSVLMESDTVRARDCWERAIALDPNAVDACNNLGVLERNCGDINLAQWFYREALRLDPRHAEAWCNLGIARCELGDIAGAGEAFSQAIACRPDYADAHMALGTVLLLQGQFEAGWAQYEWRTRGSALGNSPPPGTLPAWQGGDPKGLRLLLVAEQGLGDAIQFVRYAQVLKARGAASVQLGCRQQLARLVASAGGVDAVLTEGSPLPAADAYAFLMSLPFLLGTRVESIPASSAYLSADPERVLRWAMRLAEGDGFRVGIVWQGNADAKVDRGRSLPLRALSPLAEVRGVRLIALQKGPGSEQLATLAADADASFPVETLGADFDAGPDAFQDTAAVMMNLDLIITTDTAVAHLAGALGRPTWVLLKSPPEWRWLLDRTDSPWYPSLRLFRQSPAVAGGNAWQGVIEEVARELAAVVAGDRTRLWPGETPPPPATPHHPAVLDLGQALASALAQHRAGNGTAAAAGYAAILAQEPDHRDALHYLGVAAHQSGASRRAVLFIRRALDLGGPAPDLLANLGLALKGNGDLHAAERTLRAALALAPGQTEARVNLANLLRETGRPAEAVAVLSAPKGWLRRHAAGQRALGNALRATGAVEEAVTALRQAARLAPNDAETRIDLAHALLAAGRYRDGFEAYEARWQGSEMRARALTQPTWDGKPFAGRTLLVHGEQGLGDQIQFSRFLALAARRGGSLVLECRRALFGLMRGLRDLAGLTLIEQGGALPPHDRQIALMSLPRVLDVTLETLPADVPYLSVEPERVQAWRQQLAAVPGLKVGLAWQGNPKARADRGRSLALTALEPVLATAGVTFVVLQKEHGLNHGLAHIGQRYPLLVPPADFDHGPEAFLDTAAIMASLDLVITTDTAIAHLAGALGRPAWVLLQAAADWRWLSKRTSSPWYPTLRLFRQETPGDWQPVLRAVAHALAAQVAAGS